MRGSLFENIVVTTHKESFSAMLGERSIPISISISDSAAHLQKSDQQQVGYLLMQIEPAAEAEIQQKSAVNLAVVIDRSTSMKGERLQKVKLATQLLLDKLSPEDNLTVVTYSDRAEVVVPAGPVSDKPRIRAQISGIQAAGGTETLQGLTVGVHQLTHQSLAQEEYIHHLVLLTDGHTYGDDEECIELARQAAEQGIGISAFGIGSEWNDFFLDELVSHSGGQSGLIEEPEQIIHMLRQRIAGLGALFAQKLRLKFDLSPAVSIKEAYKITPYTQPVEIRRNVIQLGAIEGRSPLTVLFEIAFSQVEEDHVFLSYKLEGELTGETPPDFSLSDDAHLQIGRPDKKLPPQLMEAVRMINLTRMNDMAWEDVQAGDLDGATRRMNFLTRRLEEAGMSELAMTAKSQTISLGKNGTLGDAERMVIKYGTRVQLTRSMTELFKDLGAGPDRSSGDHSLLPPTDSSVGGA